MIHAQKESTQKPTSIARTTHHHFLGTLAICAFSIANGAAALASSTPDRSSQPSITETHHLPTNQNSYSVYFKAVLDAIIQVLDEILEVQPASPVPLNLNSGLTLNLSQSASTLITDYPLVGLNPTLTSSEISGGLADCSTAMAMLNDPANEITLSISTQNALKSTITSIYGELNNASRD